MLKTLLKHQQIIMDNQMILLEKLEGTLFRVSIYKLHLHQPMPHRIFLVVNLQDTFFKHDASVACGKTTKVDDMYTFKLNYTSLLQFCAWHGYSSQSVHCHTQFLVHTYTTFIHSTQWSKLWNDWTTGIWRYGKEVGWADCLLLVYIAAKIQLCCKFCDTCDTLQVPVH